MMEFVSTKAMIPKNFPAENGKLVKKKNQKTPCSMAKPTSVQHGNAHSIYVLGGGVGT